ncbi:hypothetical protein H2248_003086 [Termitomyces sp. 'cryptogamus']|nr:hypothetical protein H2248_003086 [Termitomyces sp. 'cryptogamus']
MINIGIQIVRKRMCSGKKGEKIYRLCGGGAELYASADPGKTYQNEIHVEAHRITLRFCMKLMIHCALYLSRAYPLVAAIRQYLHDQGFPQGRRLPRLKRAKYVLE